MSSEALRLISIFALRPNELHLCGTKEDVNTLLRCAMGGEDTGVAALVPHFPDLTAYLNTIGILTNRDPLSTPVVRAYWLGNDLLSQIPSTELVYRTLSAQYLALGKKDYASIISTHHLDCPYPTHLAQVALKYSNSHDPLHPYNLDEINSCMVSAGEVLDIKQTIATVNLSTIVKNDSQGYSCVFSPRKVKYNHRLTPDLKVGQNVATHLGRVALVLDGKEMSQFLHFTDLVTRTL